MIDVTRLNLFPKAVNDISIPTNKKHHVIFYSENSTLVKIYDLLKLKRMSIKKVSFPLYKSPFLIMDPKIRASYKDLDLISITNIEENKDNVFIDTSYFLDLLDKKYGKGSYKRSLILNKIIDYLNISRSDDSENILLYHVDISKDLIETPFFRRSWALLTMAEAGNGRFPFDYVVIAFTINNKVKYFSIYNKDMKNFQYSKIYNIFKSIKKGKIIEKEEDLKTKENPNINPEPIKAFDPNEGLRNEDMLGDIKYTSTQDLIKQIKVNEKLQEQRLEESIKSFDTDDIRNEDMLGDNKFTSTQDLIKQIKANQLLQESNKTLSQTCNALQKISKV